MSARLPEQFGPYLVLGELGSGGMGAVYRALDPRLEREVAVKVLHRNLEVSGARERFLREARTVSSLNHPNICTVFDIGEEDGDPFLVMELLHGESLKERVARGPVPADDLREIAFRVALALEAAHGRGVVHRDIKPANIFLVADGPGTADVKVLDFGLAKLENEPAERTERRSLTRVGATVGTVEYMSPEQACGEPLDARSDLFSLGAVLYEAATGSPPFTGATSAMVFSRLLDQQPVPPRAANLHLPPALDRAIQALLVKEREHRMPSAAALLEALIFPEEWIEQVGEQSDATPHATDVLQGAATRTFGVIPQAAASVPTGSLQAARLRTAEEQSGVLRGSAAERNVAAGSVAKRGAAAFATAEAACSITAQAQVTASASDRGSRTIPQARWSGQRARAATDAGTRPVIADPTAANYPQRRTGEALPASSRAHIAFEDQDPVAAPAALPGSRRLPPWSYLLILLLVAASAGCAAWLDGCGAAR